MSEAKEKLVLLDQRLRERKAAAAKKLLGHELDAIAYVPQQESDEEIFDMHEEETWMFKELWQRINPLYRYGAIGWWTTVFAQVYAPAHDNFGVIFNITAGLLWPIYWMSFFAFGVAHIISAWFI